MELSLKQEGTASTEEMLTICKTIMANSIKPRLFNKKLTIKTYPFSFIIDHPLFFQQLFHGADPYGMAAAFLLEALNTNA
jgi:hypothetical protein